MNTLILPPRSGTHRVQPLGVTDGDTLRVAYLLEDTVRLFGVNAPESRGPTRDAGLAARNFLEMLVMTGQPLTLDIVGREKYGRCLAKVYLPDGRDVAHVLTANGLAVAWDGHGPRP